MKTPIFYCLLLLLFAVSCGTSEKSNPLATFNFDEEMKVEAVGLKQYKIESEDKNVQFNVKAIFKPTIVKHVTNSVIYYITVNVGSKHAPIECFVYPNDIMIANAIRAMRENVFAEMPKKVDGLLIGAKETRKINSGIIGKDPYLQLDTLYQASQNGIQMVGYLKIASVSNLSQGLVCLNNSLGYQETFIKTVTDIYTSLTTKFQNNDKLVSKKEIMRLSIEGANVGTVSTYTIKFTKGFKQIISSAMLASDMTHMVSSTDDFVVELADLEGVLLESKNISYNSGERNRAIEISSKDKINYKVKGIFVGKEIGGEIIAKNGIVSNLGSSKMIRSKILAGESKSLKIPAYMASLNPLEITHFKLGLLKKDSDTTSVKMMINDNESILTYNKNHTLLESTTKVGSHNLKFKSILNEGSY